MGLLDDLFDPGKKDRNRAANAAEQGVIDNFSFNGPGGSFARFTNGSFGTGIGDLQPLRDAFLQQAFGRLDGGGGIPEVLSSAAGGALPDLANPNLDTSGFDPGLLQAFQGGINDQLGIINQDPQALAANRFALLEDQAATPERQATIDLADRLFSGGRTGTTGGQQDITAFARGLDEARTGRQVAALDFGLAQQAGARNSLAQLFGAGQSLIGNQFNRNVTANELSASRARDRFSLAQGLLQGSFGQRDRNFNEALGFTSGIQSLDNQPLAGFQAALASEALRSKSQFRLADIFQSNSALAKSPLLEAVNAAGQFVGTV